VHPKHAADVMRVGDHNSEFRPIVEERVPAHIRQEFLPYIAEGT